jgi:hypothetical protein
MCATKNPHWNINYCKLTIHEEWMGLLFHVSLHRWSHRPSIGASPSPHMIIYGDTWHLSCNRKLKFLEKLHGFTASVGCPETTRCGGEQRGSAEGTPAWRTEEVRQGRAARECLVHGGRRSRLVLYWLRGRSSEKRCRRGAWRDNDSWEGVNPVRQRSRPRNAEGATSSSSPPSNPPRPPPPCSWRHRRRTSNKMAYASLMRPRCRADWGIWGGPKEKWD